MTKRHRPGRDAGMTLVELSVTCLMLAMVLLLVASMAISLMGTNHSTLVRGRDTDEARVGMAELATALDRITTPSAIDDANRTTAIVHAGPDRIVFWAALDTPVALDSHAVQETPAASALAVVTAERCEDSRMVLAVSETPPDPDSSPCEQASSTVIARHVTTEVFDYYSRGPDSDRLTNPHSALGDIGSVEATVAIGDEVSAGTDRPAPSTVIRRFHLTQWKEF
ncbi:MAG: hypothetical protein LBK59_10515 [Bifidobacteriaceae bacterium]|jgi:hypothetical protein|nr:hypothetical protein [Bifidobacteriaceae bacterium]